MTLTCHHCKAPTSANPITKRHAHNAVLIARLCPLCFFAYKGRYEREGWAIITEDVVMQKRETI